MALLLPIVIFWVALAGLTVIFKFFSKNKLRLKNNFLPKETQRNDPILAEQPHILRKREYDVYQAIKYGAGIKSAAWFGPTLVLIDSDLIKTVNQKDFSYFQDRHPPSYHSDPAMNKMLSFATGEEWRSLKSILTQAFSTSRIRRVHQGLEESASKLVQFMRNQLNQTEDRELEIVSSSNKYLLELIATSVFGLEDTEIFTATDSPFEIYTKEIQKAMIRHRQARNVPGLLTIAKWFNLFRPDPQALHFFETTIQNSISKRKERGEKGDDLLRLLMEATADENHSKKGGLTEATLLPQALMFFFAGTEGPATLLIYGLYELAINQDVQQKLYDEVAPAFEFASSLDFETLTTLPYLDMFVSEVLRMYSSSVTSRRCGARYNLPGTGIAVSPGTNVHTPIYGIHHDHEFYPNPFKFNPENFSEDAKRNRPSTAYMPFGIGPRSCIAQKFGLVQGKSALSQIVYNFKITPCERTETPPKGSIESLYLPVNGLWFKFEDRKINNNDTKS